MWRIPFQLQYSAVAAQSGDRKYVQIWTEEGKSVLSFDDASGYLMSKGQTIYSRSSSFSFI
jgi:hypothetical protein